MRSSAVIRGTVALAATAVTAGLLTAAAGSANAATPPYEPTKSAVGTLTFYDASGAVITSGSTNSGAFAAYAVGSVAPHSGDTQALLVLANPDPSSDPTTWYAKQTGLASTYPVTTGPSAVTAATTPVYTGTTSDETIDQFESGAKQFTGTGYTNMVQVRLQTTTSAGGSATLSQTYDDADLLIDPTAHTWTEVYPTGGGTTTPPGGTVDTTATFLTTTATVRYGQLAKLGGSVRDTTKKVGVEGATVSVFARSSNTATPHLIQRIHSGPGGALTATVRPLGYTQYEFVYPGSSTTKTSSSGFRAIAVIPGVSISNGRAIRRGQTISLYGSTNPATSGIRVSLQQLVGKTYRNVATAVQTRQKLPNGKVAVGYKFARRLTAHGTYHFRVSKPATAALRSAVSRSITVTVR